MVRLNPALRQQISQAYVAHRLNNSELIELTQCLSDVEHGRSSGREARQLLQDYSSVHRDVRFELREDELNGALDYLRLDDQLSVLNQNQAWTPYQRALYRRLSAPDYDPVPMAARGEERGSHGFVSVVREKFEDWDRDQDGALTNLELDGALADASLTGKSAAAAVILRRQGTNLAHCSDEGQAGVTRQDLDHFLLAGVPENGVATFKINRGFASLLKAAETMPPPPDLMSEDFDPEKVEQGRAGACVLLSTLASKDADDVQAMFRPLPNGRVEVRFADGQTQTVRDLTLAERLYHAKSPEGGRWPGLLEVAVGQRIHAKLPNEDGSFRSSANSIPVGEASEALYGKTSTKVNIDRMSLNETRKLLQQLGSGTEPWLAGSRSTLKGQDSVISVEDLFNGISNNHAYAIQEFDAENDTVRLRNPWRHGEWAIQFDQKDDGIFEMPLIDFYTSFRWVSAPSAA
jgi:hypothetical protein